MATPTITNSLKFLREIHTGDHDVTAASALKLVVLDDTAVTFDPETHGQYSDISAVEIADGNGYTTGGIALANVAVANNTAGDAVKISCDNLSIEATDGDLPASKAAAVISDLHGDKTIVAYIDYGATYITTDGKFLHFNFSDGIYECEPEVTA